MTLVYLSKHVISVVNSTLPHLRLREFGHPRRYRARQLARTCVRLNWYGFITRAGGNVAFPPS